MISSQAAVVFKYEESNILINGIRMHIGMILHLIKLILLKSAYIFINM